MHKRPPRRKQLILRTISYTFMSIAVIIGCTILVLMIQGYQLNRKDGRIEQGGLLQLDSIPRSADVSLDGARLSSQTNTKVTLGSGQHFVAMNKPGYRQWQKSFTVSPGSVNWLNYGHLIPNDLPVEQVSRLGGVHSMATAPNREFILVNETPASNSFQLFTIVNEQVKQTTFIIPANYFAATPEGKTHDFTVLEWDETSKHALVKHTFNDGTNTEWIIIEPGKPENTKNITKSLGVNIQKVLFSNDSSNELYVQTDTEVRKVNISANTLSGPIVSNVETFSLAESTLLYTTKRDADKGMRSVGYVPSDEDAVVVRTLTDDGTLPFRLVIGQFYNEQYYAVAYGDSVDIRTGGLPSSEAEADAMKKVASLTLAAGVKHLTVEANGRFVFAQNGPNVVVYDVEVKTDFAFATKNTTATAPLDWIDDYTAWDNAEGMLRLYEFDGANQNDIMPVVAGTKAVASPDNTYIYAISPDKDGIALARARLILR